MPRTTMKKRSAARPSARRKTSRKRGILPSIFRLNGKSRSRTSSRSTSRASRSSGRLSRSRSSVSRKLGGLMRRGKGRSSRR